MADVIVVGAGITGLSCAWWLQKRGFDTEVLEAARVREASSALKESTAISWNMGPTVFCRRLKASNSSTTPSSIHNY